MKRIIFINRYYRPDHSATAQLLSDLAQTLADDGHEVSVVTSRQTYDDANRQLPAHEVIQGVCVHRIWTSCFGRAKLTGRAVDYLSFYVSSLIYLLRRLQRGDIVIAKTDPPLISVIAALCARIKGAVLINWLQDVFPEVANKLGMLDTKNPVYRILQKVRNWGLRTAQKNIVIGELMGDTIRRNNAGAGNTIVIPNWSIQPVLKPSEKQDNPLRREWNIIDKFVVGYSGNLGRAHEFQTILNTALSLREHTDIVFLFVGAGAQLKPVREFAEVNQLENILFKPYQPIENLACSLAAADVHLVSLQPELEGLIVPSKFYGILSVERPVIFIGSQNGELAHLIARHNCGVTIDPGDSVTLADYISTLHSQRSILLKTSAASGELARTLLNRNISLQRWRAVIP